MSLRNFLRRHVIADDPQPELSALDRLDLERSMADHPAGKRRPAVRPASFDPSVCSLDCDTCFPYPAVRPARFGPLCTVDCTTDCGHCKGAGRPAPESLEEAIADDDLFAVARGAGVLRNFGPDHPGWERLLEAVRTHDANTEADRVRRLDAAADAALRCYRETDNADLAMETFERLSAVA